MNGRFKIASNSVRFRAYAPSAEALHAEGLLDAAALETCTLVVEAREEGKAFVARATHRDVSVTVDHMRFVQLEACEQ